MKEGSYVSGSDDGVPIKQHIKSVGYKNIPMVFNVLFTGHQFTKNFSTEEFVNLFAEQIAIREIETEELEESLECTINTFEKMFKKLGIAFIESEAENQYHQNYGESSWENHPDEDFEGHWGRNRFREEAKEKLREIL